MERNNYKGYTKYVDVKGLCTYLSCGRNKAMELGEQFGAKIKITDKLVRYDLEVINSAMSGLRNNTDQEGDI